VNLNIKSGYFTRTRCSLIWWCAYKYLLLCNYFVETLFKKIIIRT
jgi:hypothetical protein